MLSDIPIFGEVYVHTNVVNGKSYVGQTARGVDRRWKLHLRCAKSPKTPAYNTIFSKAIRKYGKAAFEHQVLSVAQTQDELDNLEKIWIILLQTKAPNGYNLTDGGDRGVVGYIVRPEVRARLSDAAKKQWEDPEYRKRYSEIRKGNPAHANTIAACVASHLGKKQSAETIAKRVEKLKGKKRTPEQCARISASHLGLKMSSETKLKMSEAQKKSQTPERIAKIVAKNTGLKRTPQQIQNIQNGITPEGRARIISSLMGNTRTLGYKFSPEVIAKRTATAKRNRELKAGVIYG